MYLKGQMPVRHSDPHYDRAAAEPGRSAMLTAWHRTAIDDNYVRVRPWHVWAAPIGEAWEARSSSPAVRAAGEGLPAPL